MTADPKTLIDAAFAAGADGVSFYRVDDRGPRAFSCHVTASKAEYSDGRYRGYHESATGYGATWLDALVAAMLKIAESSRPRDVAGNSGTQRAITDAPADNMSWRQRRRLEARRGRG
jgi:hypothetical protein